MNHHASVSHPRTFAARSKAWWTPNLLFTAIDIEGNILRIAQTVRRKTRPKIIRFAAKELSLTAGAPEDSALLGQAIREALKDLRIPPGRVVMGLPRAAVLLRSLTVPAADDPGELAAMVHFQFGKELPFPPEEAVIDFMAQPVLETQEPPPPSSPDPSPLQAAPPKPEVLAAALRKETVEKYQTIAKAAGLNLVALGLRPHAHARCLESCQITNRAETIALVSLRSDEIIIDVICNYSVLFSRTAPLKIAPSEPQQNPPPDSAAETAADSLVAAAAIELVRSLHGYEGMPRRQPILKVVVVGNTGSEQAAADSFAQRMNVPAQVLEPAAALGLRNAEPAHAAGALAVIGLALGIADPNGLPFDFLHPKRPPVPRNLRRQKQLLAAALAAACLLLMLGLRSHFLGKHLRAKQDLQQLLAAEQKREPLYRQTRLQARTVQDWTRESQPWLDHLALLSAILPANTDLYLTSFSTSPRGSLQLSVQARTAEILNRLEKDLRQAGYDVKPLPITPTSDKFGYPFKSSVELAPPPGKKFALANASTQPAPLAAKPQTKPRAPHTQTNRQNTARKP